MIAYKLNRNYAGRQCYCPNGAFALSDSNGTPVFRQVSASYDGQNYDEVYFRLTGWYIVKNSNYFYQETGGQWCKWSDDAQLMTESAPAYSSDSVYKMINKLIANNKRILENNLLCAHYRDKMSIEQQQTLYDLQTRLQERDKQLQNSEIISSTVKSYPKGWASWSEALNAFMANGRVGSLTLTIVVSVVIIASLVAAAYWAYKYYYDESLEDVKYSDELTKILTQKLTAEEYEALKKETAGMLTKTKLSARFSNAAAIGKGVLYAMGGLLLVKIIMNYKDNKNKQQ